MKATRVSKPDFIAECESCPEKWFSRNALAVASQHAERHGHYVHVTQERRFVFDGRPVQEDQLPL